MLPAPVTVSTSPLMVPVPVLLESTLNTTALPKAPPVALSVTISLGTKPIGEVGGVKLIVWLAAPIVKFAVSLTAAP